jgi:hypothetical protein
MIKFRQVGYPARPQEMANQESNQQAESKKE